MTPWRIDLTETAEADYFGILDRTMDMFGPRQADVYEGHLLAALTALEDGPNIRGSVGRPEIRADLRDFHIGRRGASARHVIC